MIGLKHHKINNFYKFCSILVYKWNTIYLFIICIEARNNMHTGVIYCMYVPTTSIHNKRLQW